MSSQRGCQRGSQKIVPFLIATAALSAGVSLYVSTVPMSATEMVDERIESTKSQIDEASVKRAEAEEETFNRADQLTKMNNAVMSKPSFDKAVSEANKVLGSNKDITAADKKKYTEQIKTSMATVSKAEDADVVKKETKLINDLVAQLKAYKSL